MLRLQASAAELPTASQRGSGAVEYGAVNRKSAEVRFFGALGELLGSHAARKRDRALAKPVAFVPRSVLLDAKG
jgi:hypothetical protein